MGEIKISKFKNVNLNDHFFAFLKGRLSLVLKAGLKVKQKKIFIF